MKVRKFYPKQVMRSLSGKATCSLDKGEMAALRFFQLRNRKFGFAISVIPDIHLELDNASGFGRIIMSNCSSKILLKEPKLNQPQG